MTFLSLDFSAYSLARFIAKLLLILLMLERVLPNVTHNDVKISLLKTQILSTYIRTINV